jgi:Na+-transporting NADH:ubiquinone oxidoreductase subunit C
MQYSTSYIVGFAAVVCLVCSVFVAGSAVTLKPLQDLNVELDRQKQVLTVAGLMRAGQSLSAAEVGEIFNANVKTRIVELETGDYAENIDPVSYNQRKAAKDPERSVPAPSNRAKVKRLPKYGAIFQVNSKSGELQSIIVPIEGKGLWSTMYGYIALAPDTRTIRGITFYEHGETPGLGGEVDNPRWKALWEGRLAFDERWVPRIEVIKGAAGPVEDDPYRVDGLSGATLTSNGVSHAVRFWLGDDGFGKYLEKMRDGKV